LAILAQCPQCNKKYKLSDKLAGKRGKCAQCGEPFLIPGNIAAPESAPVRKPPAQTAIAAPEHGPELTPVASGPSWLDEGFAPTFESQLAPPAQQQQQPAKKDDWMDRLLDKNPRAFGLVSIAFGLAIIGINVLSIVWDDKYYPFLLAAAPPCITFGSVFSRRAEFVTKENTGRRTRLYGIRVRLDARAYVYRVTHWVRIIGIHVYHLGLSVGLFRSEMSLTRRHILAPHSDPPAAVLQSIYRTCPPRSCGSAARLRHQVATGSEAR